MDIIERMQHGLKLLMLSVRIGMHNSIFILYAVALLALAMLMQYGMHAIGLTGYALIALRLYALAFAKTIFTAIIVHQAANLPGGIRPSLATSINHCWQEIHLLAFWALAEIMALVLAYWAAGHISVVAGFIGIVAWYTLTLPIIPLIVDDQRSLPEMIQQAVRMNKKLWVEALTGVVVLSIGMASMHVLILYSSLQSLPALASLQPPYNAMMIIMLAGMVTLIALFKAVMYRAYNRDRQLDLQELQSPYF